jgi:Mg2+/Co2+ transporter CorB
MHLHPSLATLLGILAALLGLAAFFAGSETALMSLNRYRLRHSAQAGNRGARLAEKLLAHPDRLIGLILLLSTIVNVAAPMLVEYIAFRLGGDFLVAVGAAALTLVMLILCEVAPKTYGALHPERLALPAAYVYTPLLLVFNRIIPFVWATNLLANGVLRLFGVSQELASNSLSSEELRTVVAEAGAMIPHRHQQMLVSILDLEKATVEDIMVPRTEIVGIDVDDDWDKIVEQLRQSQHTRLPVYEGEIDRIIGVLHMKGVVHELARGRLERGALIEAANSRDAYFVPSGTTLNAQLLNFQRDKRRMAFVVDEYGDIQGLVTLEDILEEIVGEFTTDPATMMHKDVHAEADGSFVASASTSVRALNRSMRWSLPTDGPKTLNGLIVEFLETIPETGTTLKLADYMLEVLQTGDNAIKTVRIRPPAPTPSPTPTPAKKRGRNRA